jgi:hypothetical protein
MIAGEGMQFESYLGHSRSPRQRGFCFNVWTNHAVRSLWRWVRALAWPPRWPVGVWGWRDQGTGWWASACSAGSMCSSLGSTLKSDFSFRARRFQSAVFVSPDMMATTSLRHDHSRRDVPLWYRGVLV